jgi:hypothetical protein
MNHPELDDTPLARTMKALAEIEAAIETPPRVEAAVMAQWDARRSRTTARLRTSRVVRGTMTAAAGITLVGALVSQRSVNETASAPDDGGYQTVAVVGGPLMANEPIRVVRMRVERSALGELGIPSPARQGPAHTQTVDIDVLVGEDGVARGVRVPIVEAGL